MLIASHTLGGHNSMALSFKARASGCSSARGRSANVVSARPVGNRALVPNLRSVCNPNRRDGVVCNGLFGLGLPEIAVIAGVAAVIWGPSKLPELGKGLGQTLKSFQTAAKEFESELKTATADDEAPKSEKAELKPEAEKPKV